MNIKNYHQILKNYSDSMTIQLRTKDMNTIGFLHENTEKNDNSNSMKISSNYIF